MTGSVPAHGFVLAGGNSSRMGQCKPFLPFLGRPMAEIAVRTLRGTLPVVSISGNHQGLERWAPVVHETRLGAGPAAGMEAGLRASTQDWSLFVPVDVPLAPATLLAAWARSAVFAFEDGLRLSYLQVYGLRQPAFCLMHRTCLPAVTAALDQGVRKLGIIFDRVADTLGSMAVRVQAAEALCACTPETQLPPELFSNVNTPADLATLELWAKNNPAATAFDVESVHA